MSYMGHAENCTCSECYVRRQQTPPAPVAQPVYEQQTIEIAGLDPAKPRSGVRIKEMVPLPRGVDFATMAIVGAARLEVAAGEVVALLVRFTWGAQRTLAVWWDREVRAIVAQGVEE